MGNSKQYIVNYSFMKEGKIDIRYREVSEEVRNKYRELYLETLPTESELNNLIEKVETKG